jgi:phosphatidylinositol kinase/protein kinase (PI-3  family)
VLDNFVRSLAAYSVATYVLGIGDRHNDNVMITRSGKVFHIDFAYFLGNFLSFAGIQRETTPFLLPPEFMYVLGGPTGASYLEFVRISHRAYLAVRRRADRLLTMFTMMMSVGLPQLSRWEHIYFLRNTLCLDESEARAASHFDSLIRKSQKNTRVLINNAVHILYND